MPTKKTDTDGSDQWLTLDEAAREFQVSRRTLERLRAKKVLPGTRTGRYLRMRREDVRRALIFQDPTATYRELLSVPEHTPLKSWLMGWKATMSNLEEDAPARLAAESWIDAVIERHPDWTVGQYTVGHAVMAAEAAGVPRTQPIFIAALKGIPQDLSMLEVLQELFPLMNPMLREPEAED